MLDGEVVVLKKIVLTGMSLTMKQKHEHGFTLELAIMKGLVSRNSSVNHHSRAEPVSTPSLPAI